MAGVLGAAYYYAGQLQAQRIATYKELQIFADSKKRIRLQDNNIWWVVKETDYNYTKTVYVFNPNSWSVTADMFWEAFPEEMTQYCEWRTEAKEVLQPLEIAEIKLYLIVKPNDWLGISAFEGDVLTQIGGETR